MSVYSIYFSPTKSTEKVTKLIAGEFGKSQSIDLSDRNASFVKTFNEEDICIVGVPSYGGRVPDIAIQRMKQLKGNNAKVILVVTYGNRAYEDTLKELLFALENDGFLCVAAIAAITEHSIMHQFATGRPDANDQEELKAFANKIKDKINTTTEYEDITVPGNYPFKEYKGVPLKPRGNSSCIFCGQCADLCPVGAIPLDNYKKTDMDICISCMRCVEICPAHARKVNSLMVKVAAKKMKAVCDVRKENELFL